MTAVSNAPGTAVCGCSIRRLSSTLHGHRCLATEWQVLAGRALAASARKNAMSGHSSDEHVTTGSRYLTGSASREHVA
jgi:hypothetical protein